MQETNLIVTQDFYEKHLSTINSVRFTSREIDVVACLLSARGTSKIASLLAVNPRTVETHVRNIMSKLECNSREGIIDFIETSDKLPFIRKYYSLLQNEILFEKALKNIGKLNKDKVRLCLLTQGNDKDSFILHLKSHLELAGFKVSIAAREKKGEYTLFVLPCVLTDADSSSLLKKIAKSPNKVLLLQREKKSHQEMPQELVSYDTVDFSKQENYFFGCFLTLNKLLPNLDLDKLTAEFKDKYKRPDTHYKAPQNALQAKPRENYFIYQKWHYLLTACFFIALLVGSGSLFFYWIQKDKHTTILRSDLMLPSEAAFLNRSDLIAHIDNGFKDNKGIQTVALVGIGGSGKTTLARQYADQTKATLVWEINAETHTSLIDSFENLASALATTEEDKQMLSRLQEIKNTAEREKKLIEFVKGRLKIHSDWLLVYDNVEKFTDIQKYFPLDPKTWGQGKVILTTRNNNIQNSHSVNHVLQVGTLRKDQAFNLFTKIMNHGENKKLTGAEKREALDFLKQIPPFPLDISIAACYLKTMNSSYAKYLEHLKRQDENFTVVQENLLTEVGAYAKTRHKIITTSLKQLLTIHKDFGDLLLFISLLDSQNIPRKLLNTYKNEAVVDNFVYHLKKYSLITTGSSALEPSLSIHRSTQDISFDYLNNRMKLDNGNPVLKEISYVLDDYTNQIIEQEDLPKMRLMTPHLEKVLSYHKMLTNFSRGLIKSKLGSIYYFINKDKSRKLIDDSFKTLKMDTLETLSAEEKLKFARSLLPIGAVYTELRLDKNAQEILEEAVNVYNKGGEKNYADLSWALAYLGNLHRKLGNYKKSRKYLEESFILYQHYGTDNKRMPRILAYLGTAYRDEGIGAYRNAIETLEKSLALYRKYYSNDHYRVGWVLVQLGIVFNTLGDFQKAKIYLENSILVFQKHLPKHHLNISTALNQLGNCYRALGEHEKSRHYLEQSLKIHQKHFNKNHLPMGWALFDIAKTHKALGNTQEALRLFDAAFRIYSRHCDKGNVEVAYSLSDMAYICIEKNQLDKAEYLAERSLKIFQEHGQVSAYKAFELLGEIYLKKVFQPHATIPQEAEAYKTQALDAFQQALKIAMQHFPANSSHTQRLQEKISKLTSNTNL
jgi:tetratricopeptide (TPR) repeat protein/DNA-binding CsgD family transcriptional regulator